MLGKLSFAKARRKKAPLVCEEDKLGRMEWERKGRRRGRKAGDQIQMLVPLKFD